MATQTKKTSSAGLLLRTKLEAGCVGSGCILGGLGNHNETLVAPKVKSSSKRAGLVLRTKIKAGSGPGQGGPVLNHNETLVARR